MNENEILQVCDYCGKKKELKTAGGCPTCVGIIIGIDEFVKTKKGKLRVLSALYQEFNKAGEPCSSCGKSKK